MVNYENVGAAVWRIQTMRPIDEHSRIVVEGCLASNVWDGLPVNINFVQVDGLVFERPNCGCSESSENVWDLDTVRRYVMRIANSESLIHQQY